MADELVEKPLEQQLLESTDQADINRIIGLFNLDLKKKAAIRAATYSNLQDTVTEEIKARLQTRSGEFSNKDLLEYLTTFDNIVNKSQVEKIDVPQIAIQQNINVNGVASLDREARIRIQKAVEELLNQKEEDIIDVDDTEGR